MSVAHEVVHGLELSDEKAQAEGRDGCANLGCVLSGRTRGAEDPVVGQASDGTVGDEDLLAAGLGQRTFTLVGGHADDFDPLRFGRVDADKQALADSGLAWKDFRRDLVIDQHEAALGEVVGVGKGAAIEEWNLDGFEITGEYELSIGAWNLGLSVRLVKRYAGRTVDSRQGPLWKGGA